MYCNYYWMEFNLKTFQITQGLIPHTEGEFIVDGAAMFSDGNLVAESYKSYEDCFKKISIKLKQHLEELQKNCEHCESAYIDLEYQRKYGPD